MNPIEYLSSIDKPSAEAFRSLRQGVLAAGPLDDHTCEFIVIGALATIGSEASLKVHARRLLKEGVPVEALRHAVLVTFGATTIFTQVVAALRWIDEVAAQHAGTPLEATPTR